MTRLGLPLFCALILSTPLAAQDDDDGATQAALVLSVSARGEADAGGTPLMGVESGQLRAGRRRRFRVRVPDSGCVLIVAEARGVEKVSVALTVGRRTLARAEGEQTAHTVHCHQGRATRARLEVRAHGGRGPFAAGAYQVSSAAAEPAGATAHEVLEGLKERHAGAGYVAASPTGNESLTGDARSERRVALVGGSCYRVLAGGGPGVSDVALKLSGPRGETLQEERVASAEATLGVLSPLCPTRTARYALTVSVTGGGDVAWQIFRAAAAERAAAEAAARPRPPVGGTGTGYVARRLRERHGQVGEGMVTLTPASIGTLQRSETKRVTFEARASRCYRAIAVGMPSVRALRIRILDRFGSERADSGAEAQPSARFCPTSGGTYRAELKAENGYGGYALQVFESRR